MADTGLKLVLITTIDAQEILFRTMLALCSVADVSLATLVAVVVPVVVTYVSVYFKMCSLRVWARRDTRSKVFLKGMPTSAVRMH